MQFLYDNLAAFLIAACLSLMGWLYGGTRSDMVASVTPWCLLFLMQTVFFFPQKSAGESTYAARSRVWRALRHDPLVWVSVGLLILLAIPFLNTGLCVSCDWRAIAAGASAEPPVAHLPFCVNRLNHLNVFLWFAFALTVMLATKHALVARGRRLMIELVVWNGALLAALGFIQLATDAPGPLWQEMGNLKGTVGDFFSTFGYPNMAGDYFVTLLALALAVWRCRLSELTHEFMENEVAAQRNRYKLFWRKHFMLVVAGLFFLAAINTLSRAAMMLATAIAFLAFFHALLSFTRHMKRADRLKKGTVCLAILGVVMFFASFTIPENVQREIDTINTDTVLTRVSGKGQYHQRVATEIWKDNFLFGCGGWGYKHFCIPKMTPEEIKQIQMVGGINVHNDYLQFLAEHGLVGFGTMIAIVLLLLHPILRGWARLAEAARFSKHDKPASPLVIFAFPAPAFMAILATLATFIHGFGDCPLRSPAVLSLFFAILAAIPGYLPESVLEEES